MQPDFDRSAAAMVSGTQKAIAAAVAPLLKRIEDLEARQPLQGPPGERGNDGVGISDICRDGGVFVIQLSDGTEKQVDCPAGEKGEPGQDGVSPDPDAIIEAVAERFRETAETIALGIVSAAVAELPQPEKGEKGDQGEPGKGISDLLRDHEGNLVATMDDGRIKNLGPIQGKDGAPGKDGRDGFSLEDFDIIPNEDGRTIEMKFASNGTVHTYELEFPVVIDRGVFKQGETYKTGDAVTWGGSLWIAQVETGAKPDSADNGWRLAVKKGRDGKDAKA